MTQDLLRPAARLPERDAAVLAEAGQCMEGDVHRAVQMALKAADAGAWGFKVQMLTPDRIASADAPVYWQDTIGNTDQRGAFTRAGLVNYYDWAPVVEVCRENMIAFAATPFDEDAVEACVRLGVDAVKVASGDLTNYPLLSLCAEAADDLGARLIISTGAALNEEVLTAMDLIAGDWPRLHVTWLACTLAYPTQVWDANLGRIPALAALPRNPRSTWTFGYSDHTLPTYTALGAAAAGARLLEKHYTDGHAAQVEDNTFALDAEGLEEYVANAGMGATLRGEVTFDEVLPAEEAARHGARRSLHLTRPVAAGEAFTASDFVALRPGGGVSPSHALTLPGHRPAEAVPAGRLAALPKLLD